MKLARKSVPFIIAVALLAACLLAVGLSPWFSDYKEAISEENGPKFQPPRPHQRRRAISTMEPGISGAELFREIVQLCGKQRADFFGRRLLDR